jgi:hypothetical protein
MGMIVKLEGSLLRLVLIGFALALATATSRADDEALIAKVKTTWRAQDGETAEEIIGKASKVAHFIPRGWEVGKAGESQTVFLSWAKHRNDKKDDEYTIYWEVAADGTMTLGPYYAKPMELGWQAFALSLVSSEVLVDEEKNANLPFLHDLSNFNFVTTPQGKLGDLLKLGGCVITNDPVHVEYAPPNGDDPKKADFWAIQLEVDCDVPGPRYFIKGGIVMFDKHPKEDWRPFSSFSHVIASQPPGFWFKGSKP